MSSFFTGDYDADIYAALKAILKLTHGIDRRLANMNDILTALLAQVTENTTLEGSVAVLLGNIEQQLATALAALAASTGVDPATLAQLDAIRVTLKTSADSLSAAVVASTPTAPIDPTV